MLRVFNHTRTGWYTLAKTDITPSIKEIFDRHIGFFEELGMIKGECVHEVMDSENIWKVKIIYCKTEEFAYDIQVYCTYYKKMEVDGSIYMSVESDHDDFCDLERRRKWFVLQGNITSRTDICLMDMINGTADTKMVENMDASMNKMRLCDERKLRIINIMLPVNSNACCFVKSLSYEKIKVYKDVICVNGCYTGTVIGNGVLFSGDSLVHAPYYRIVHIKGTCGAEIIVRSISEGVVQIFSNNNGMRRVTCKGFSSISKAKTMVSQICTQMGLVLCTDIIPHMLVLYGNTGMAMDIKNGGFVVDNTKLHFPTLQYSCIIEEVNVHLILEWDTLFDVYENTREKRLRSFKYPPVFFNALHLIKLTVSVTCRGTCIYRIAVRKINEVHQLATINSHEFETFVLLLCSEVHDILSMK